MKTSVGPGRPNQGNEEYKESDDEFEQHEISSAADTLLKAEEIKGNHKLHGHAVKHMAKKAGHLKSAMKTKKPSSVDDLRKLASDKSGEE